jgi:hypothetical protein
LNPTEGREKGDADVLRTWVLAWIPMVPIAILNAVVRETVYAPHVTDLAAHQISSVTLVALFAAYTWFIDGRWRLQSRGQALSVGAIWLVLTPSFEFVFGHYVMGNPWSVLLNDYNLLAGRVWSLVLIALALLPYAVHRIRESRTSYRPRERPGDSTGPSDGSPDLPRAT